LWEVYVIEGLDRIAGLPPNSFAVLTKNHHAAVDGASGLHFLTQLHDPCASASRIEPPRQTWQPEAYPSDAALLWRTALQNMTQPLRFAATLNRLSGQVSPQQIGRAALQRAWGEPLPSLPLRAPKTRFNGRVTAHRVMGEMSVSLADVKHVRSLHPRTTVNDVVLSVCGGALRLYLLAKNELDEASLVAMAPVNIRNEGQAEDGGNQVSALFVPIGTDIKDPLERLQAVQAHTQASKAAHAALNVGSLNEYGSYVPAFSAAMASRLVTETASYAPVPPFNVSITNVPGPVDPLYFGGAPMRELIGIGPISAGMGLIFPVLSYNGRLSIGFTSCREMLPDPENFEACLRAAWDGLYKLTATPAGCSDDGKSHTIHEPGESDAAAIIQDTATAV